MARGQEETSTNQARIKRGTPREMATASSLVATMSIEELRSFSKVPVDISFELSDGAAAPTIGGGGGGGDSCHSRGARINNICILNSSYCRSKATVV